MQYRWIDSLSGVEPSAWDRLVDAAGGNVFLRHAWLYALEASGCVGGRTGWQPCHLLAFDGTRLSGALPCYLKSHSYGEYVFDWAWADAYRRAALAYYPKLVAAVPFSPCPGPRLLAAELAVADGLVAEAMRFARVSGLSSLHVLFPSAAEIARWTAHGLMHRQGVQFHWQNAGYADFEQFLATMTHDKRKRIRQDRRYVEAAGVRFRVRVGRAIQREEWAFFRRCYELTYFRHHSTPYLNLDFFTRIGRECNDAAVLFIGERAGVPICSSLCLASGRTLYGRYWGAIEPLRSLHFEACYYQPIAWAITHGFERFEGGAQGTHKLARGLLPAPTHSAHWIADPRFASAIDDYLARERIGVAHTLEELAESTPFKQMTDSTATAEPA